MFWLFRMPAFVYLLLAPIALAAAGYLYFDDQKSEAAKAVARAAKPPALVKIEAFDPARNIGTANEVNVLGQVDFNQAMEVTRSKRGSVRERWTIAPVYSTTATDTNAPAIGVMLQKGEISDEQLQRLAVGQGAFGPIMALDGTSISASSESQALGEVSDRMKIAPNALYIDPFEAGRGAGLAPSSTGRDASIALAVIALLVAAYGAFRLLMGRRQSEEEGY